MPNILLLLQPYQWLKDKIMSEDGRKQQAKLKDLAHIAEKLGCTLPQLAIGKGRHEHPKTFVGLRGFLYILSDTFMPQYQLWKLFLSLIVSLVLEERGSELSAPWILQSNPANREPGSHTGTKIITSS